MASGRSEVGDPTGNRPSGSSMSKDMGYENCPRCGYEYDILRRVRSSRIPLILPCKHTICEGCLTSVTTTNIYVCTVCKAKCSLPKDKSQKLEEVCPPHYDLIGRIVWNKHSYKEPNFKWKITTSTSNQKGSGSGDAQLDDNFDERELDFPDVTLKKCTEHPNQIVNLSCEDCRKMCCSYCILEYHQGHKSLWLYKLSEEETDNGNRLKAEIEYVLTQLLESQKKLVDLKKTTELSQIEKDLEKYFLNLHAKLHIAECNCKKVLKHASVNPAGSQKIQFTIREGISRCNNIINQFRFSETNTINVRALYEEIANIRDMPCRLVSDQEAVKPIKFMAEDLLNDIEGKIQIKKSSEIEYNLLPVEDWSYVEEKCVLDKIRRSTEEQDPPVIKDNKKPSVSLEQPKKEGLKSIVVTHINSVNSFYIQEYESLKNLKRMSNFLKNRFSKFYDVAEIKIGGVYAALYMVPGVSDWRRAKVMARVTIPRSKTVYFKVLFIDYGNTKLVSYPNMKPLDPRSLKENLNATECSLLNLDIENLERDSHLQFAEIIHEKELYLKYFDREDVCGPREVDIYIPTISGNLVSVRDLLTKNTDLTPTLHYCLEDGLEVHTPSPRFNVGDEIQCFVTFIKDPLHIYVQLAEHSPCYREMYKDMEPYYEVQPSIPYLPVEGTYVVVNYKDKNHGNWHRAKITSVDAVKRTVNVLLVDWGKELTDYYWTNIKMLTAMFVRLDAQGILVQLADIDLIPGMTTWTKECIEFLHEYIPINEELSMCVGNLDPIKVAILLAQPNNNVCVNSVLVYNSHACSTGSLSSTMYWPKDKEANNVNDDDAVSKIVQESQKILATDYEHVIPKFDKKAPVSVVRVDSPDMIYLKLDKNKEDQLQNELKIHYNGSRQTKDKWEVGEKCVVLDPSRRAYFRAGIKSEQSFSQIYTVDLYDFAQELIVPLKHIYIYDPYFNKFGSYIMKCRLSRIKPAGDTGTWSRLAIEILEKIFSNYKTVFIKKMEVQRSKCIFGILMWYSVMTKPPSALEPSVVSYVSINDTLVESGVAIGTNTPAIAAVLSDEETEISSNESFTRNQCETISDKAHLEDIKTVQETEQIDWPEMYKFDSIDFYATLTCIDVYGVLSIRDHSMRHMYDNMKEALTEVMNNTRLPQLYSWKAGDKCIIFVDDEWFRGTVVDVLGSDKIRVEMIDFGSEHFVTKNNIAKCPIAFQRIPPLLNKVKFFDVRSKCGVEWSDEDIDTLLQLATAEVRVVIKEDFDSDTPAAEVFIDNGISLNNLIVRRCPHMYRTESPGFELKSDEEMINEEDIKQELEKPLEKDIKVELEDFTDDEHYQPFHYLPFITTTAYKPKFNIVSVFRIDNIFHVTLSREVIDTNAQELCKLNEEIQASIGQQPIMRKVRKNRPYVCLSSEKNLWLRAQIYRLDTMEFGYVWAFFVDYGTVEMTSVENIKKMKSEWLQLPASIRVATLNFNLIDTTHSEFVLQKLMELCGESVKVKILKGTPLKVHLYESDNRLCYQDLADWKIIEIL